MQMKSVFDTPISGLTNEQVCLSLIAAGNTLSDLAQTNLRTASLMCDAAHRIEKSDMRCLELVSENIMLRTMLVDYGPKCRVCGVTAEYSVHVNGGICNDCKARESV